MSRDEIEKIFKQHDYGSEISIFDEILAWHTSQMKAVLERVKRQEIYDFFLSCMVVKTEVIDEELEKLTEHKTDSELISEEIERGKK